MRVQNIKQTIFFMAGALFKDGDETILRLEGEDDETFAKRSFALRKQMVEFSEAREKSKTEIVKLPYELEELQACIHPERLLDYKRAGAELPSDRVQCTISVGSLIFDLYALTAKRETAPLAIAFQQKEVQNLAKRTKKEFFDLEKKILEQIRPGIEDPKLWEKLGVSVAIETPADGPQFVRLTHHAANYFRQVLDAVVALFCPQDKAEEG